MEMMPEGGRGDHRPDPPPFPADDGTPSPPADINIAGSGASKTAGVEGMGERDWGMQRIIGDLPHNWANPA